MSDPSDFSRLIADYQLSYGNELQAKLSRLDGIIGDRHWLSVGNYKENLIKSILRNRMPKKYEVGTGFVLTCRDSKRVISQQIDVLIWDCEGHSPLFRDGEFVIVPPEACVSAIEVKSTLTVKSLREALTNLDSLSAFLPDHHRLQGTVLSRSVFAFALGGDLKFPTAIWNGLYSSYMNSEQLPLDERVKHLDLNRWQPSWISTIAVLGHGVINSDLWGLNGQPHVVHTAYRTNPKEDSLDAYGFLERSILADLTLGYQKHFARETRPGLTNVLFANQATPVDGKWYMPVPSLEVTKVGRFNGTENEEWVSKAYTPDNPTRKRRTPGKKTK